MHKIGKELHSIEKQKLKVQINLITFQIFFEQYSYRETIQIEHCDNNYHAKLYVLTVQFV